jgi:hypothetical protein
MTPQESITQEVTCGCGDISMRGDMCHICGRCQIGCCDCVDRKEFEDLQSISEVVVAELATSNEALKVAEEALTDIADTDSYKDQTETAEKALDEIEKIKKGA